GGYVVQSPKTVTVFRGFVITGLVVLAKKPQPVTEQVSPRDAYNSPYMILANGVPNLAFEFDGQIYHASFTNGAWAAPVALPQATGHEPVLVYSDNLLLNDAAVAPSGSSPSPQSTVPEIPGMAVFFRANDTNSANGSVI